MRLTLFFAAESVDQTGSICRGKGYQSSTLPGNFRLDGTKLRDCSSDLICKAPHRGQPDASGARCQIRVVYYQDNGGVRTYLWWEKKPDFLRRL